ncbi:hypothetical protein F5Y08DRAFT_355439 [Xylaria arbuscula]|nr:hypothetical protein F5Y08DRAFT_355439 [Xylaria arbuscula]
MERFEGKVTEHPTKKNLYTKTGYVLSAWIVITTSEPDASLRSRICFPRRFCVCMGKPINPLMEIQYEPLRTASSVLEIGGELYVISSRVRKVASSETEKRMGEVWDPSASKTPRYYIKECWPTPFEHVEIDIVECSMPVNTKGFVRRRGVPKDGETVKMLTVGGDADQEYDAKSGHFVDLLYQPQNLGYDTFGKFTVHRGELRTLVGTTLTPRLTEIDAGSLVSQNGCYIGIVEWLWVANGRKFADVLVFDDKLLTSFWHYLHPIKADGRTALKHTPFTITRAYKHLEYHG